MLLPARLLIRAGGLITCSSCRTESWAGQGSAEAQIWKALSSGKFFSIFQELEFWFSLSEQGTYVTTVFSLKIF